MEVNATERAITRSKFTSDNAAAPLLERISTYPHPLLLLLVSKNKL